MSSRAPDPTGAIPTSQPPVRRPLPGSPTDNVDPSVPSERR